MHKLIFIAAFAASLAACKQPAPEASAPVPPAVDASAIAPATDTPSTPAADDHQAVNASIDSVLGDHKKYESAIVAYQRAVAEGDQAAVAALVGYPFQATLDGKKVAIKDRAEFVKNYDRIITPAIAGVIKAQKYSELMVNSRGVMFGSGETWINGVCKQGSADCSEFEARVVAIQPTAD
ncbi:MAG TPA: hypothetical protein VIT22_13480 [Pseudoxanthomonas sp.]